MNDMSTPHCDDELDLSQITTYQAGVAQATTHRILQKYCDDVLGQYGITKMHWLIIGTVLDAGPAGVRLTELSETLGTTMPYITSAVNLLESKHMLTRTDDRNDSRAKKISINKTFAPKCTEIETTLRQALRQSIYARIDPTDFRTYMKVLFQLGQVGKW